MMTTLLPGMDAVETKQTGAYTVLARRYRSTSFEEIVGQETIASTLRNAIDRGRTAHAYLFTGTRGVGKTSMARIFAKTLNVSDALREKDAIAAAILRGDDIDVIEIDGASNRGIDEVRDLIANAGLRPARCPYKIYIIDEVHMLTVPAFNALLKVMEEPPSHVKFILCTTESHRVPATIQSRCQRFDFRNIPAAKIAAHLREVLEKESIEAEPKAVLEVARLANGSMRDGLSLLDRLIAAGDGRVTEDVLQATLGTPDHALVAALVDGMAAGDPRAALTAASDLLARGTSIEQALETLAEHLRNVMVIAACGKDSELVELFGDAREAAERHAERFDLPAVVHMIALCETTSRSVKASSTPRALFDAVIVRLALTERLASIPALLQGSVKGSTAGGAGAAGVEKKKSDDAGLMPAGPASFGRPTDPASTTLISRSVGVTRAPMASTAPATVTPAGAGPVAAGEIKPTGRGSRAEVDALASHPIVARVRTLFNAEIVSVQSDVENIDDHRGTTQHDDRVMGAGASDAASGSEHV